MFDFKNYVLKLCLKYNISLFATECRYILKRRRRYIVNSLNILKICKDNKAGSPFAQQELSELTSKSTFEH